MDRSYLSDTAVVAASRAFVCIRLLTYESTEEAEVLKRIFIGRSGELENTTFAILDPTGKKEVVRGGRGPRFGTPSSMARRMTAIANQFDAKGKSSKSETRQLPTTADFRRALNTAACDAVPLVVGYAKDDKARAALEKRLAELAWHPEIVGRFEWSVSAGGKELEGVAGLKGSHGVAVIAPGTYGRTGKLLAAVTRLDLTNEALRLALLDASAKFEPKVRDQRAHVRTGFREGVRWETAIPVTDPGPKGNGPQPPPPDGRGPRRGPRRDR